MWVWKKLHETLAIQNKCEITICCTFLLLFEKIKRRTFAAIIKRQTINSPSVIFLLTANTEYCEKKTPVGHIRSMVWLYCTVTKHCNNFKPYSIHTMTWCPQSKANLEAIIGASLHLEIIKVQLDQVIRYSYSPGAVQVIWIFIRIVWRRQVTSDRIENLSTRRVWKTCAADK